MVHTDYAFFCVYVSFTKECIRVIQKWGPHHHPISHYLSVMPSSQSLDRIVIPSGQPRECREIPLYWLQDFQGYKIFRLLPPHFPNLTYTRGCWNTLNVQFSDLFPWSLSQSLSGFIIWGLLKRNSEAAIYCTTKRYPHSDSAFYLQSSKMKLVVSSAIQSLPHSTLTLQVSSCSICDHCLQCHKAVFITTQKTWGKLKIIGYI